MGKKQLKTSKGKIDKDEISSPILDPETIKAIHTPPNQKQKEGGFKALFANSGSQELINDISSQHLPSYVGISCAICGYTNYSPYLKLTRSGHNSPANGTSELTPSNRTEQQTRAATLDSSGRIIGANIKRSSYLSYNSNNNKAPNNTILTASDLRRVPSPVIPRKKDDRHHGTCVGARYCLLPAPGKAVNKHIPLLGIDDDKVINDDDPLETEANKSVQNRIASLYGNEFAEGWKETNASKARKDTINNEDKNTSQPKEKTTIFGAIKDFVKLKRTPSPKNKTVVAQTRDDVVKEPDLNKKPIVTQILDDTMKVTDLKSKQFVAQTRDDVIRVADLDTKPAIAQTGDSTPVVAQTREYIIERTDHPVDSIPVEAQKRDYIIETTDYPVDSEPIVAQTQDDLIHIADHPVDLTPLEAQKRDYIIETTDYPVDPEPIVAQTRDYIIETTDLAVDSEPIMTQTRDDLIHIADHPGDSEPVKTQTQDYITETTDFAVDSEPIVAQTRDDLIDIADLESKPNDNRTRDDIVYVADSSSNSVDIRTRDGQYFLDQLKIRSDIIDNNVNQAEAILNDASEVELMNEEIIGMIHSAIGKANLLLNKKCKQFTELCADNLATDKKDGELVTLNDDLQGFWDMITIQLNECEDAFIQLWAARENGWKFESSHVQESSSSSSARSSQSSKLSKPKLNAQKDQERRNRLQEHINQMKQKEAANLNREN